MYAPNPHPIFTRSKSCADFFCGGRKGTSWSNYVTDQGTLLHVWSTWRERCNAPMKNCPAMSIHLKLEMEKSGLAIPSWPQLVRDRLFPMGLEDTLNLHLSRRIFLLWRNIKGIRHCGGTVMQCHIIMKRHLFPFWIFGIFVPLGYSKQLAARKVFRLMRWCLICLAPRNSSLSPWWPREY